MNKISIKIGLTPPQTCSYLPTQEQSLAFVLSPELHSTENYQQLLSSGFRRTGENIYRPQCANCSACHSLRIDTLHFSPSKSQKRQLNQLSKLEVRVQDRLDINWYPLYERYILSRHQNGVMYPPNKDEFLAFIQSPWQDTQYLHLYDCGTLIAIATTDVFKDAYSAIYTFFDPDSKLSLGSLCVLAQIQHGQNNRRPWLYLGFQIEGCSSMNYKKKFKPNQRYINGSWKTEETKKSVDEKY